MRVLRPALLLFFATVPRLTGQSPASPDPRAQLLAADHALSDTVAARGLVAALPGALTENAIFLYSGAPVVQGRAGVEALLEAQRPRMDSLKFQWQALEAEVSSDGSFGTTFGIVTVSRPVGGETALRFGRFITAWKNEAGVWRIAAHVQIGNPGGLPYVAVAPPPARLPHLKAEGSFSAFVKADQDFAALAGAKGAVEAFRSYAADDAITFGQSGVLNRGPERIGASVEGPATWAWWPVAAGGAASGDLGFTVGEAVITPRGGEPSYGKYLTIWRNAKGKVRFLTDGGSSRPAS